MSPTPMPMVAATNDEAARWKAWQRSYISSSQQSARHARIAFAILLTGAAVWLGLQIMSMPV
jgi:hypothetical protein